MSLGNIFIIFAILATFFSFWNYLAAFKKQKTKERNNNFIRKKISLARTGYFLFSAFIMIASMHLLYLLLTHHFQVKYVYDYTSKDLSFYYIISAFWAGQEGSFLLWILMIAIFGTIFIKISKEIELPAMILLNSIQFFFLIILIKASPFELLATKPHDGAGLNPLLQNPWMAIHPPVLFAGYAAISFPYIITLGSLLANRYKESINQMVSWTLLSIILLGTGIMLGAYWAYGVLGWGGYWGWDPVENSSLIPWLFIIALLHGLFIQRRNNKLYQLNAILAICSFILVLYATFLTRSGILSDFSVHSFLDRGINTYLIVFIIFSIIIPGIIYLKKYTLLKQDIYSNNSLYPPISPLIKGRRKAGEKEPNDLETAQKPTSPPPEADLRLNKSGRKKGLKERDKLHSDKLVNSLNRENALYISILVILTVSFLILFGTSFPIITSILGKAAQLNISFYNKINLPFAILMGLLLGIAPFLLWSPDRSVLNDKSYFTISLITALLGVTTSYLKGITQLNHLCLLFAASFALVSNSIALIKKGLKKWPSSSSRIAHIGVGLLFIGIIVSGVLSIDQQIIIHKEKPVNLLDYQLIYKNKQPMPDGKDLIDIKVTHNNTSFLAQPRYYLNRRTNQWIREPYIYSTLLEDIYISPLSESIPPGKMDISGETGNIILKKGEITRHKDLTIYFKEFELAGNAQKNEMRVGARLEISKNTIKTEIMPVMIYTAIERISPPVQLSHDFSAGENPVSISLLKVNADDKTIMIAINDQDRKSGYNDHFFIQFSIKPLMSILWLGCFFIILGSIMALYQRLRS
jgi:cytochrome c biogenesis factor